MFQKSTERVPFTFFQFLQVVLGLTFLKSTGKVHSFLNFFQVFSELTYQKNTRKGIFDIQIDM